MKKIVISLFFFLLLIGCVGKDVNMDNNKNTNKLGLFVDGVIPIFIKNAKGDNLVGTPGYTTFSVYYMENGVKTLKNPNPFQAVSYIICTDTLNNPVSVLIYPDITLSGAKTWFEYNGKETEFTVFMVTDVENQFIGIYKLLQDGIEVWDSDMKKYPTGRLITIVDSR